MHLGSSSHRWAGLLMLSLLSAHWQWHLQWPGADWEMSCCGVSVGSEAMSQVY